MPVGPVLVTAFEPFGGEALNASWEAARRIDGVACGGSVATALRLPCVFDACVDDLFSAIGRTRPCAVLMTGQAASRRIVSVERLGRNRTSATARDNRGALGSAAPGGPAFVATTTSARGVARAIRAAGVLARASSDAGDYVCNHLYYRALRRLAEQPRPIPAVFVHLPATLGQGRKGSGLHGLKSADAARALCAAAEFLAIEAGRARSV